MQPNEPSSGTATTTPPSTEPPSNTTQQPEPSSSLPTEPASNTSEQPQPQVLLGPVTEVPKKKHRIRRVILIVLAIVVILMGISVFVYLRGKIAVDDLVTENSQGTTYLRPHQWKALQSGNVSGYGNMQGKDGKSTAGVFIVKTDGGLSSLAANDNEDGYAHLRQQVIDDPAIEAPIPTLFKNIGAECNSNDLKITKEIDATSTPTTVGILKLNAACAQGIDKPTVKMRVILGKDGYIRVMGLVAPERDWELSSEAFQKMLDSLAQAE